MTRVMPRFDHPWRLKRDPASHTPPARDEDADLFAAQHTEHGPSHDQDMPLEEYVEHCIEQR